MTAWHASARLGAAVVVLAGSAAATASEPVHWTYQGHAGPDHWGELSADWAACSAGQQQSPIDLTAAVEAELAVIDIQWGTPELTVVNNGHTIQLNAAGGGHAIIDGEQFSLVQFHFHTPSEHAIEGTAYPMEAHFVHAAADGRLAVVGVMMEGGGSNALFSAIMDAAPAEAGEASLGTGDPASLIADRAEFWRYQGSLTTPPCAEVVSWTVLRAPVQVAQEDIDAFQALFATNARPLQPVNRRYLLLNQ